MTLENPWDHNEWPYFVEAYYADNHPTKPGGLAFRTKHKSVMSRDIEIEAAHSREDIGQVFHGPR